MPYSNKYIKPKALIIDQVWHTYKEDMYENPSVFWYTTNPDNTCTSGKEENGQFDIRRLPNYPKSSIADPVTEDRKNHKLIVKRAIDYGYIVPPPFKQEKLAGEEAEDTHVATAREVMKLGGIGPEKLRKVMYEDVAAANKRQIDKVKTLAERYGMGGKELENYIKKSVENNNQP